MHLLLSLFFVFLLFHFFIFRRSRSVPLPFAALFQLRHERHAVHTDILFAGRVGIGINIGIVKPIDGSPARDTDEHPHGVDVIDFVAREPVINPLGQRHQIALLDMDADPSIERIPDVEESRSVQDVPDLFRVVDVFREKVLHVRRESWKVIGMDRDDVRVGIPEIVPEGRQSRIDRVLGIPGNRFDGILVRFGIHLPVIQPKVFHVLDRHFQVRFQPILTFLVVHLLVFHHVPCLRPIRIDDLACLVDQRRLLVQSIQSRHDVSSSWSITSLTFTVQVIIRFYTLTVNASISDIFYRTYVIAPGNIGHCNREGGPQMVWCWFLDSTRTGLCR